MHGAGDGSLRTFMSGASQRFASAQITVSLEVDLGIYRAALESFRLNPSSGAVLSSPMFQESHQQSRWHVWLSRPHRRKIDRYDASVNLVEMAGGNEEEYWQAFPCERRYHVWVNRSPQPAVDDTIYPCFHTWLPPAVAQLLDPDFIWGHPEGYAEDPAVRPIGEGEYMGRAAITAELTITDWMTRGVGWSEILFASDRYELKIDKSTGILLEVISLFGSQRVSRCSVESLFLDGAISPAFFTAGHWADKSWRREPPA